MTCLYPLKAYARQAPWDVTKKDLHFVTEFTTPFIDFQGKIYSEQLEVPCGQCIGCRLEYSRQWANRCVLEASQFEHNYFVTLTYNDCNLPLSSFEKVDKNTGEYSEEVIASLRYSDVQNFLKRLRTKFKRDLGFEGLRYFGGSEYGPSTQRPHYHLILFNCPLPDLVPVAKNFRGETYYESEFLSEAWSLLDKSTNIRVPIGFCSVADFSWQTAAYVARYIMKKHKGLDSDYYEDRNIEPERSFMSRMPGIARTYFDENSQRIYDYDQIIITGSDGIAKRVRPPRYYDSLYEILSPDDFQKVKEIRSESGKNARRQIEERTGLSRDDYLKVCESKLLSKIKSLPRDKF